MIPSSTYRLQFRNGMDFDRAVSLVPYLQGLGIGALYASPLFTATTGSTHGYDVTDPTQIDPVLGGREGLTRLSSALREHGLGLILDIVPNHMAFSVETPWLRDILRRGTASDFARHFDTDLWAARLRLPWLNQPFEEALQSDLFAVEDDFDGPVLTVDGGLRVPLAATATLEEARSAPSTDALRRLHAEQPWELRFWRTESDSITHRRFFSVTGLIGTRVEDPRVFDDVHGLLFDLIEEGIVSGVRVDHIDGLGDPDGYLDKLRERIGDTPIWVEKILTGDETMRDWPIQGTTGYEVARDFNRALTRPEGLERIREAYRERTGREDRFAEVLTRAKTQIVTHDLAAELWTLHEMLTEIAARDPLGAELGPETLREGIIATVVAFPRYRSYRADGPPSDDDRAIVEDTARRAAEALQDDSAVRLIARVMLGEDPAAAAFRTRFQQVTGAAMAKSLEDTAFYREVRLLSLNEVGGEPNDSALDADAFHARMHRRAETMPHGLTLTSSHDTKRSEDARMRLAAITWAPEPFLDFHAACADFAPDDVRDNLVWYMAQTLLAIHGRGGRMAERLREHVTKALREAKRDTFWTAPDVDVEARALALADRLSERYRSLPETLTPILAAGERLSLIQAALKLTVPGIPDIYQGCEIGSFRLTDPDNRADVPFDRLSRAVLDGDAPDDPFDAEKLSLVCALLRLRREMPGPFSGRYEPLPAPPGALAFRRSGDDIAVEVRCNLAGGEIAMPSGRPIWPESPALTSPVIVTASQ